MLRGKCQSAALFHHRNLSDLPAQVAAAALRGVVRDAQVRRDD